MKRQLFILFAAALVLAACTKTEEHQLLPAGVDVMDTETPWLWGYVNEQGEMVIAPQFAEAMPFSDGYARVALNDIQCFIDSVGNVYYLPDTLQWVDDFHNGYAHVGKVGDDGVEYYGVIDKSFQYVVPPTQDNIEGYEYEVPYRDDRYMMNVGEWYLTDEFDEENITTIFRWHAPNGKVVYEWRWAN